MPINPYMPATYNPYANMAGQFIPQYMQKPQEQQYYYVHGIEGANAFQMPPGVNKVTLWDETNDQFFVKGYDNNGIPRVLAWKDYHDHVAEPEPVKQTVPQIDLSKYVTVDDLNKMLGELTIGANGRIVRQNEHDV